MAMRSSTVVVAERSSLGSSPSRNLRTTQEARFVRRSSSVRLGWAGTVSMYRHSSESEVPLAKIRKMAMGPRRAAETSFSQVCASLEEALSGDIRGRIIEEVMKARTFDRAVRHLRDDMRRHRFDSGGVSLFSGRWVKHFDHLTRGDQLHALHDWDGKADRFNDDIIPVEMANFAERTIQPTDHAAGRVALSVLLDYYFVHLLGLVALRAFDEGAADTNLDRVTQLLGHLQGPLGSGQMFARSGEALILIATSHFEPEVTAYRHLLARIETLGPKHRLDLALPHAAILGCHLRFGLEVTCAGNVAALRDDNVPDYPWLCSALRTLLEAYGRAVTSPDTTPSRSRISEALLLGLMPDAQAFLGSSPPDSLAGREVELGEIRTWFQEHRTDLLHDFEVHRPSPTTYSPLSFTFNFPHNLVKGIVVDAARRGLPWALSLEDLVTALPRTPELDASRRSLATTLMGYALASPDLIRGRLHPAIVCDPAAGLHAFEETIQRLSRM